jgi:hypothetical protein
MSPGSLPALEQLLLVKLRPGEYQSKLPLPEAAIDCLDLVDPDPSAPLRMPCMEVRAPVVVVEHRDGYAKEAADRRHAVDVGEDPGRVASSETASERDG